MDYQNTDRSSDYPSNQYPKGLKPSFPKLRKGTQIPCFVVSSGKVLTLKRQRRGSFNELLRT